MVILMFTDFGRGGPYLGQMRLGIERHAPGIPVIDLMSDLTPRNPRAAAYLLASLSSEIPPGSVLLAVVDPGVGTESRQPVVMRAGDRWYVGPGNGLFSIVAQQHPPSQVWEIRWRPSRLSDSFHGRDLFAPVAAMLARGDEVPGEPVDAARVGPQDWPDDLAEIIYLDEFGNAMTGMRASTPSLVRTHRRPRIPAVSAPIRVRTMAMTNSPSPGRANGRYVVGLYASGISGVTWPSTKLMNSQAR